MAHLHGFVINKYFRSYKGLIREWGILVREREGGEIVKKGKEGWQRGDLVARGKAYHKVIVGMGGGGLTKGLLEAD